MPAVHVAHVTVRALILALVYALAAFGFVAVVFFVFV